MWPRGRILARSECEDRLTEIFSKASQLSADERAAYLDRACDGDPELRREVDSLLAFDERADELLVLSGDYLEREAPRRSEFAGSYAQRDDPVVNVTYEWSHGLGEIVGALLERGLVLESLDEHRFLAWQALPQMQQRSDGFWELPAGAPAIPLSYTLRARQPV